MRTSLFASLVVLGAACGGQGSANVATGDLAMNAGDLATSHDLAVVPGDLASANDLATSSHDMAQSSGPATFTADVLPVLSGQGCLSCHMTSTWDEGETKTSAALVSFLTSTKSSECPTLPYVTAGSPANSYLYQKITGTGSCFTGNAMPDGSGPLDSKDASTIESWITAGANAN